MAQLLETATAASHRNSGMTSDQINETAVTPHPAINTKPKKVVTFTSDDGEVFEIPDLPENLGRATALASERSLSKIWGTQEEDQACQNMFGEKSS